MYVFIYLFISYRLPSITNSHFNHSEHEWRIWGASKVIKNPVFMQRPFGKVLNFSNKGDNRGRWWRISKIWDGTRKFTRNIPTLWLWNGHYSIYGKTRGGSAMYFLLILTIFTGGSIQTWGMRGTRGELPPPTPDKSNTGNGAFVCIQIKTWTLLKTIIDINIDIVSLYIVHCTSQIFTNIQDVYQGREDERIWARHLPQSLVDKQVDRKLYFIVSFVS